MSTREIGVSFYPMRGYFTTDSELRTPVVALGGLRRRIEALMLPDEVRVMMQLDGLAERERHRRPAPSKPSVVRWSPRRFCRLRSIGDPAMPSTTNLRLGTTGGTCQSWA